MRFSNPSPGSVATLVDDPIESLFTLAGVAGTGNGPTQTLDISSAMSLDIQVFWQIGTTKANARWFADLEIDWLDASGNIIYSDSVEIVHQGAGSLNAASNVAIIRCPAVGATAQFSMLAATPFLPLAANDKMIMKVVQSNRPTDRFRMTGQPGSGFGQAPDNGYLLQFEADSMAASAASFIWFSTPYCGPVQINMWNLNAGTLKLFVGAQSLISGGLGGTNGTPGFDGFVRQFALAANQYLDTQFYIPRSSIGVQYVNGATAGGSADCFIYKSDN